MPTQSITPITAKEWLDNNEAILIDVREPAEFNEMHIAGAHLIPVGTVCKKALPEFQHKKIIVHCRLGKRGQTACEKLCFDDPALEIYNIEGGIIAWENAGFPVEKAK